MPLEEHRYSILLVSASETFNASLQSLFSEIGFLSAQTVSNISAAKRAIAANKVTFPNYAKTPEMDDNHRIVVTPLDCDKETALQAIA